MIAELQRPFYGPEKPSCGHEKCVPRNLQSSQRDKLLPHEGHKKLVAPMEQSRPQLTHEFIMQYTFSRLID
ncbi:hypothetical protein HY994_02060 [Candidatus Micrarchaeota archaeon]|nr:hypothetical protein [Candidatus Micrarchaeota archaeon]